MSQKMSSVSGSSGLDSDRTNEKKDTSLYDSGFLSGANLVSETLASGEITPASLDLDEDRMSPRGDEKKTQPDEYMRLDSGVDVGLSEQLSELNIEDASCEPSASSQLPTIHVDLPAQPSRDDNNWELYFQQDDEGDTQLHIAIIQGFVEVVFSLIRMVPSAHILDIRNDLRQTALHLGVLTSQPKVVRRLVAAGCNTRSVDRNGNTALHLATYAGDIQCIRALTEPVTTSEVQTSQLKYSPSSPRCCALDADMYNYEGLTCVHIAAMSGKIGIMKYLVKCGADIDSRECKSGRTPLHLAAEMGDESLAVMLLTELQADPGIPNYAGHTPYHIARRNPRFIKAFVSYGGRYESDYSSEDDFGEDDEPDVYMVETGFKDVWGTCNA